MLKACWSSLCWGRFTCQHRSSVICTPNLTTLHSLYYTATDAEGCVLQIWSYYRSLFQVRTVCRAVDVASSVEQLGKVTSNCSCSQNWFHLKVFDFNELLCKSNTEMTKHVCGWASTCNNWLPWSDACLHIQHWQGNIVWYSCVSSAAENRIAKQWKSLWSCRFRCITARNFNTLLLKYWL